MERRFEIFEISGYNKERIETLRDVINATAQSVAADVVDELHSGIIVPMSEAWYAEEAQHYFETFAQRVKETGERIKQTFDEFRVRIQKTGEAWASVAQGEAPVLAELEQVDMVLSTSEIKNVDSVGNRALNEAKVQVVIGSLDKVEQNIKTRLARLAQNLDASTSFLGHGQGVAISEYFGRVVDAVHGLFSYLLVGDNALSGELAKYKAKYADSAESVASSYSSSSDVNANSNTSSSSSSSSVPNA